jgi:chromosomal replication initiator protein
MPIQRELAQPEWPEAWLTAYRILETTLVANQLRAWVLPLRILHTERTAKNLIVHFQAPNDFSAGWVRDHLQGQIEAAFAQVSGSPCTAIFVADSADQPQRPSQVTVTVEDSANPHSSTIPFSLDIQEGRPAPKLSPSAPIDEDQPASVLPTVTVPSQSPGLSDLPETRLNPNYTFDSFVVGSSNNFAHASAIAVAENPGKQYNPLFLYGPPGLGKTHLLHAIGNHVRARNPQIRIAYLSAEKFIIELIDSLQHNRMNKFRQKYRDSYDLILIDDIQFIAGKTKTEEEFFHTFNALHETKRQIIITCDRPPKEIQGLEERLRSRFEWGLLADIQPPEIETRIAILKTKAERDDMYLPDDAATFLATHIKSNIRELEGMLVKLQAQASMTGSEVSLDMAKNILKSVVPEESSHFTAEAIQSAVAKHFHLRVQDLKSTSRAQEIALPRQIAMFLIRKYTGMGLKEIGQHFGGKDHTTVLHACEKIHKGVEAETDVKAMVESIQNIL